MILGILADSNQTHNLPGEVVNILVGRERKEFAVHDSILRATSPFFGAAFGKEWKESRARGMKLPKDKPETFHAYVQWLYTGVIFCKATETERNIHLLPKLYVFGESCWTELVTTRSIAF